MRTIGGVLDENRGIGKGFDFLRVFLAFAVVTWHCWPLVDGYTAQYTSHLFWFCDYWILFLFFGLSGFLITGSAQRLSLRDFLINRGLRIFPALTVEIVLAVAVIGPLFTTLPLKVYLSNPQTLHYMSNIVGLINYHLPGVFTHNHDSTVNGSLWTVPYELGCYAMISIFISFGLLKRPWVPLVIAMFVVASGVAMFLVRRHWTPHGALAAVMIPLFFSNKSRLFVAFPLGVAAYLYRYKLPYSLTTFVTCLVYLLLLCLVGHREYAAPAVNFLTAGPLIYVLVFLGVSKLPMLPFFHRGDYSYGVYLYGWPIEQAVLAVLPRQLQNPVLVWLIICPLITLFAVFSWHAIEKPILKLRKQFSFVARQRIEQARAEPALAEAKNDQSIVQQSPESRTH